MTGYQVLRRITGDRLWTYLREVGWDGVVRIVLSYISQSVISFIMYYQRLANFIGPGLDCSSDIVGATGACRKVLCRILIQ